MLSQVSVYLVLDHALSEPDVLEALLDLFGQRCLEVQLVDAIQRDHWVQQVVGVQTLCANLLLALQTEQDEVLHVLRALLHLCVSLISVVLLVLDEACQVVLQVLLVVQILT